jgi:Tripartite tricarboxylate transporter TctB family
LNVNGPEDGREEILRPSTSPLRDLVRKRDFYAGGLMLLLGLGIALKGAAYRLGSPMHMGPGFFPTSLGVLLVLIGIAIAGGAIAQRDGPEGSESILPENPQWWAWSCILLSPVFFIIFGRYFGMAPGTFACVFIAALGDRSATWKSTFILASVVTVFGVSLFSYFLQVPMPIFTLGGGL